MPELPEVETVRRGLSARLLNARIEGVRIHNRALRWPIADGLEQRLAGQRLRDIERRSKYLLFRLSSDTETTLLAHLGMTGSFVLHDAGAAPPLRPHDHVQFDLRGAGGERLALRYNDPRRFGSIQHFTGADSAQPLLAHLGPEPLTAAFTGAHLYAQTRRRSAPVKLALMDNALVVGVGNIYANESLFRAGIRPDRAANAISLPRYERLAAEVKAVLAEAIKAGGSTLRDFVNASGEPGYFQLDYYVYGRGNQNCRVCATPLRTLRQGGRATVFCPRCQR